MNNVLAIIWDFDGTLVDTRQKNLNVTRRIIEQITQKKAVTFPVLSSLENYISATFKATNWRELYTCKFGLTNHQTYLAGKLWTEYQLQDNTPTKLFPGVHDVLLQLKNIPHGIVSQNSYSNILKLLNEYGLEDLFKAIIGYEEVDIIRQKPEPDGLLACIDKLCNSSDGNIFYIGDHETDIVCAARANKVLQLKNSGLKISSIAAHYGVVDDISDWNSKPDFTAEKVEDIIEFITLRKKSMNV
jgi:HAD superfamily hydrolase (TIGR01549 family)